MITWFDIQINTFGEYDNHKFYEAHVMALRKLFHVM